MRRAQAGQMDGDLGGEAALVFGGAYSTRYSAHSAVKYASDWQSLHLTDSFFTRLGVISDKSR